MQGYPAPLPPVASVADFALAQATGAASRGALRNRAGLTTPLSPAVLVAPASAIVAAITLKSVASGVFMVSASMDYSDSAPDSVTAAIIVKSAVTSIVGGTTTTGVQWASSPIVATGGTLDGIAGLYGEAFGAGNLTHTIMMAGLAFGVSQAEMSFLFEIIAAGTITPGALLMSAYELP
jgi:hypothetical protein